MAGSGSPRQDVAGEVRPGKARRDEAWPAETRQAGQGPTRRVREWSGLARREQGRPGVEWWSKAWWGTAWTGTTQRGRRRTGLGVAGLGRRRQGKASVGLGMTR